MREGNRRNNEKIDRNVKRRKGVKETKGREGKSNQGGIVIVMPSNRSLNLNCDSALEPESPPTPPPRVTISSYFSRISLGSCVSLFELKLVQVKLSGINSLESHVRKSFASLTRMATGLGLAWLGPQCLSRLVLLAWPS